jgi:hypothetical protein
MSHDKNKRQPELNTGPCTAESVVNTGPVIINSVICTLVTNCYRLFSFNTPVRTYRLLTSRAGSQRHHDAVNLSRREFVLLQEIEFRSTRFCQFFHRFFHRSYVLTHPEARMGQYKSHCNIPFLVFLIAVMMGTAETATTPR